MKSVNSKDKCYRSRLSVRTSHMWFPRTDLPPKSLAKNQGEACLECRSCNQWTVFIRPQGLNVCFWLTLMGSAQGNIGQLRVCYGVRIYAYLRLTGHIGGVRTFKRRMLNAVGPSEGLDVNKHTWKAVERSQEGRGVYRGSRRRRTCRCPRPGWWVEESV